MIQSFSSMDEQVQLSTQSKLLQEQPQLQLPMTTTGPYFRAYTSLFNAEAGDENDGIDDDLEAFESWSAEKDLTTSGEQWNIACYGDGIDSGQSTEIKRLDNIRR